MFWELITDLDKNFYFKKNYIKKIQVLQLTAFCYYFWHFLGRLVWQVCFDLCISEIFCLICFCWKTIIYVYHSNIIYILRNLCLITLANFVILLNKLKLTHCNLNLQDFKMLKKILSHISIILFWFEHKTLVKNLWIPQKKSLVNPCFCLKMLIQVP